MDGGGTANELTRVSHLHHRSRRCDRRSPLSDRLALHEEVLLPRGEATAEIKGGEVDATEVSIVRHPGLNVVVSSCDRPEVPEPCVGYSRAGRSLVRGQEDIGDALVIEQDEVEATPTEIEAGWATRPAGPVNDTR